MSHVPEWTVQPEGMPDLEREVHSEARAASVATAMMIALMPAFGMPPRIQFKSRGEGSEVVTS
jgi:hypothetical protein